MNPPCAGSIPDSFILFLEWFCQMILKTSNTHCNDLLSNNFSSVTIDKKIKRVNFLITYSLIVNKIKLKVQEINLQLTKTGCFWNLTIIYHTHQLSKV